MAAVWGRPLQGPKVPRVTPAFWLIKGLSTAFGEATSDFSVHHGNPYLAVMAGALGFLVAFALQWSARRYVAWRYWLLVVMVAVFGTMVADVLHVVVGVPYAWSTAMFAVLLTAVFVGWYRKEGTLSIHAINTRRREAFYWAAVVATFAMGTATGDMTAVAFHWGYLRSGLIFACLFALALVARWAGAHPVLAFWAAYVLTRPLGASFADWFGKPVALGGLGYGDGAVAGVLALPIVGLVAAVSVGRLDAPREAPAGVQPESSGG
ncbi:MAG: hypothetical protein K6U14_03280 [Firmicutes bacterium]|nr:hypothetical protein [Alicyclobacillaceae bacterium]MCL6496641.1 hypothetical protein [Bacillota bacterium]